MKFTIIIASLLVAIGASATPTPYQACVAASSEFECEHAATYEVDDSERCEILKDGAACASIAQETEDPHEETPAH